MPGGAHGVLRADRAVPVVSAMEATMAAFARVPWGRYVYVRRYRRLKSGKWELIDPHLRKWPGGTGALYFHY